MNTIKIAYLGMPGIGGPHLVYLLLKRGLAEYGYDVHGISAEGEADVGDFAHIKENWTAFLGISRSDPATQAKRFIEFIEQENYPLILFAPGGYSIALTNAIRFLPRAIRRIGILHNMTRGIYAAAHGVAGYTDHFVAVSDRIRDDFVRSWRMDPARITTIFHGVEIERFSGSRPPISSGPRRLLLLGRIEEYAKGIGFVPAILSKAVRAIPDLHLDVVGDGPDRKSLERNIHEAGLDGRVTFHGAVHYDAVPRYTLEHDIFVMPSRYEGCGIALLEAMAGGCVPVATRLKGVTDSIIENGISGFVCRPGDTMEFARNIERLARNPDLWARMSDSARLRIATRFSARAMMTRYAKLLSDVLNQPETRKEPVPLSQFSLDPHLQPTWRTRIPVSVKVVIRKWAERFGWSL